MQGKFLKEVVVYVAGKPAEKLAELINSKKHVNEFLIAKKLEMTINQVRNLLYRLSDQGLVSSIRKKDKKKGWYTYFWKIEVFKSLIFLEKILKKRIEQFQNQIKSRETKVFYVCDTCGIEYTEENAMLYDFTCDECGNVFSLKNSTKILRELNRQSVKMKEQLKLIQKEIEKEKEKYEKKQAREQEKLKKEKQKKRALARKIREGKKKKTSKKKKPKKLKKKKSVKKKTSKKKIKKKVPKKSKKKLKKKQKVKKKFIKKPVKKKSSKKKISKKKR